MMINELIEKIGGRERLELASRCKGYEASVFYPNAEQIELMARALLAVLGQGCLHHWISSEGRTDSGWLCSKCGDYDGPPASSAPDGWLLIPAIPSQSHLNSIAMRYRHDFYLLPDTQRESVLSTARQMYEECSGQGFYSIPKPAAPAPGGEK